MITRPIPSSREPLPIVGLGTWQTFDIGPADRKPLEDVLSLFVQLGGRVVDSSPMYGRSESVLGELAVKMGVRDQLFVATKVWTSGKREGIAQMQESEQKLRRVIPSREDGEESPASRPLGGSVAALGMRPAVVDLMQVHNLFDADTHLETLREWKRAGRIRYIGVTHYTASAYRSLERYLDDVDFLQINYSLAERDAERRIIPLAAERKVAVLINRPFGGGTLFRDVHKKPLPSFAAEIGCTSWAELFLKFVLSHPGVTCAIPATSKVEHLRQNMNAGRGLMPDAKIRQRIAAAV